MRIRVRFRSGGESVVGDLYLPAGRGPHRAVVLSGPMTSVKEQVTGVYAAALAARGFAALAFDPRHFGESGGLPRQYEHHREKVADLQAALEFLAGHEHVAGQRLGIVGVCLGAGYAACAAVDHARVAALALVAGYYRDVAEIRARDPEAFERRVAEGIAARVLHERTGEVVTIPAVALEGDAAMTTPELHDYYGTPRAGVPNYVNGFAVMSREHFLPFDVQSVAPRLAVPTRMIHSESALSPAWARRFHARLTAAEPIEWVEAPSQVAFYDDPRVVLPTCDRVAAHLAAHLG